jgi:hypothetical protein
MGAAAGIVASIAAPLVGSVVQNILGSSGGAAGAGGPFGNLLSSFTSAFSPLLGQLANNPVANMLVPGLSLFSTNNTSSQAQNYHVRSAIDRYGYGTVRDHRTGVNSNTFTSPTADDRAKLAQIQADAKAAKNAAIDDPENLGKQLDAQELFQSMQNMFNLLSTFSSTMASLDKKAIDNMQVA